MVPTEQIIKIEIGLRFNPIDKTETLTNKKVIGLFKKKIRKFKDRE